MSMISDLVKKLRWIADYDQYQNRNSEVTIRKAADTIEMLSQKARATEQGWIPCSERLPEAEEKVWIQTERGKVCFAMYEDGTISEDDSDWHWYDLDFDKWDEENDCGIIPEGWWEWTEFHPDNEFDCPVDEVVVAWMPLPKPWKGADDEVD